MKSVITHLWRGSDLPWYSANAYGARDVLNLYRGVKRHVTDGHLIVMCDQASRQQLEIELPSVVRDDVTLVSYAGFGVGGWTNILEGLRPALWEELGIEGRAMMTNLDIVLVGDCNWMFEWDQAPVGLHMDPYYQSVPANAVMSVTREGAAMVWSEFLASRSCQPFRHTVQGVPSEEALLRHLWKQHGWPWLEQGMKRLLSWKACGLAGKQEIPPEASVVYFHGRPKPGDIPITHPVRIEWERP